MLKDLNILYLEDEELIKDAVERTVNKFINELVSFKNPIEALEYLETSDKKFDLIITDIQMPKMNGLEFIRFVQEKELNIPIIVITAYNTEEYLNTCKELNVDKVIQKPVNLIELFENIEKIVLNKN